MGSEDNTYQSPSSINTVGDDNFLMEPKSQLQKNDTVDHLDNKKGPSKKKILSPRRMIGSSSEAKSGASRQRKRQAPDESPKGKGKGRTTKGRRRSSDVGEPFEAFKQQEPTVKELIMEKSVAQVLEILCDKVDRQIAIDQTADMKSSKWLSSFVIEHQVSDLLAESLSQISRQLSARSDLDNIMKDIEKMKDKERAKLKLPTYDDKMKMEALLRLEEIEDRIKSSVEERRKDSTKTDELVNTFLTKGVSLETLNEEFSTAFPFVLGDEVVANKPPVDQFQGSLQTRKDFTVKDMEDQGNLI